MSAGSPNILTFTLDTCVVIALIDPSASNAGPANEVDAAVQILDLAQAGCVRLAVTEAHNRDVGLAATEVQQHRARFLAGVPHLAIPTVFHLDEPNVDRNVVLGDDSTTAMQERLLAILPHGRAEEGMTPKQANRAVSDHRHLQAHWLAGADVFVTTDDDTILRNRDQLSAIGIIVEWPTEALTRLQ